MSFIGKALLISAIAALSAVGCSKGSDSAAGDSTPTMSITGTMAVSMAPMSVDPEISAWDYVRSEAAAAVASISLSANGDGSGQPSTQTACTDGFHYRVLCSAWSTPPVSAYGDVSCSGGSGGFTVAGLPLNTEISCFIRKSTDGTTFKPFATLELPAASLSGTTDTIVSSGDMALTVSVNSATGVVGVTVASGTNSTTTDAAAGAANVDPATLSGFYNMTCPEGQTDTVYCKCFILGNGDKDTCIAGSASSVTATAMTVNLNVYKGVATGAGVDLNGDATVDVAAGGSVFAGTIWGASNASAACTSAGACTSMRTGAGEGLPAITNLDWSTTAASLAASAAITWTTGAQAFTCGGSTANATIGAIPGAGATRLQWLTWLQNLVDSYSAACDTVAGSAAAGAWQGCNVAVVSANRDQDAFCVGNFVWQIYQQAARNSGYNLPKIRWDWSQNCSSSGCSSTVASKQLMIEGIDFNGVVDASVPTFYNPTSENRFMFDQWLPNAAGTGGSLKEHGEDFRSFDCATPPSGVTCTAAAVTAGSWAECKTKREMIIKFIPGTTAGTFNTVFNETNSVAYGKYRGGAAEGTDAYAACAAYLAGSGTSPAFVALATKL